jgi:hypothetical protein
VRFVPLILAAAALAACGEDGTPATSGDDENLASLVVRVDDDGDGPNAARELELECDAPTDSSACGAAAGTSAADLAPTEEGKACTQLFGGPQTASIKGTLRGEEVDATFSRRDGCEIARWERVAPLLEEVR